MKILVSESVNENRIKLITKKVLNERYFLEVEMTQILNEAEEELLLESDSIEKLKEIARMFGNGYVRWMSRKEKNSDTSLLKTYSNTKIVNNLNKKPLKADEK